MTTLLTSTPLSPDLQVSTVDAAPRIEIRTLVQDLTRSRDFCDTEFAEAQNDGWEVLDIAVSTHMDISPEYHAVLIHTRIVTLCRERVPQPERTFEELIAELEAMPNVAGVVVETVTPEAAPVPETGDTRPIYVPPTIEPVFARAQARTFTVNNAEPHAFLTSPDKSLLEQ